MACHKSSERLPELLAPALSCPETVLPGLLLLLALSLSTPSPVIFHFRKQARAHKGLRSQTHASTNPAPSMHSRAAQALTSHARPHMILTLFLKMDIEGSEFSVVEALGRCNVIVDEVIVEVAPAPSESRLVPALALARLLLSASIGAAECDGTCARGGVGLGG